MSKIELPNNDFAEASNIASYLQARRHSSGAGAKPEHRFVNKPIKPERNTGERAKLPEGPASR